MIDLGILSTAISLATGRLVYHDVSSSGILACKIDRVVSLPSQTPCWMVKQENRGDSLGEVWVKDGVEVEDEAELTDYRITLPMSQWEEL